jgi:hypothetical protein
LGFIELGEAVMVEDVDHSSLLILVGAAGRGRAADMPLVSILKWPGASIILAGESNRRRVLTGMVKQKKRERERELCTSLEGYTGTIR